VQAAPPAPVATSLRYDTDYPLIRYADRPTHNAIARLQDRLDKGEIKLKFVPGRGPVRSAGCRTLTGLRCWKF
jgi:hypothetical protein